ncbi:MAG: hypothetical protein AUJ74_00710 [Candidatus Omnitrophica bacterium CG1_02_44_16]|nr:MAG: hypothetical protein AUJ74_00710 [Candidatus Omnitrophica bacterium CG1_02_44_16]PIY82726.1 MAG: hypothetical protein COY78_05530 [Candidatus Omnitrophica bacterium CG_4_10_14_0_8_um_filter_44_12]PIZ84886.1 MAG: hypothetical protein COX96_01800 [Candidatus Omnitrophica bacterium CG_4_10_14_0_2_um_filter_44_9]
MSILYGGPDRRKDKRVKVNFIVGFLVCKPLEVHMSVENKQAQAAMADLSKSGMAIVSDHDLPEAAALEFDFTLVTPYRIDGKAVTKMKIEGNVVNRADLGENKYRLGIEFTKIAEKDEAAIADFVKLTAHG